MAKATSQQSKYLLRIRGKQDFCLAFGQRTRLEGATDKVMGNEYSLLLTSLHVCKEMYKPGVIEADVQIIKTKYAATSTQVCAGPDDAAIFDNLLGARVDLTDQAYEKEGYDYDENMAKDYIFYNYEPRFENVGGVTGFYVRIYAYSPDKMLTLRRYSACYTGKVLGEDILIDIVDSDKNAIIEKDKDGKETKKEAFVPSLQLDLHQLSYQSSAGATLELIQPYLVQHNETEHEFISRVANRCGEFFFYENGALHLGCVPLKNAAGAAVAAKQIGIFRELTMPGQYAYDDHVPAWISDYTRDEVAVKSSDPQKTDKENAQAVHKKQANDVSAEYDGPATDQVATYSYDDKNGWTDFGKRFTENTAVNIIDNYAYEKSTFWISRIKKILQQDTIQEALGQVVYDLGKKTALDVIQALEWKDKERTDFLDPFSYSEMKTDNKDKTTVGPYSNYAYALDGKFYSTMSQLEKDSAKTLIRIVQEADSVRPQFLGSTFLLSENSTDEYAVVKVTYDARLEADGTTRTYSCVVEAVKRVKPTDGKTYAHQEDFVGKSKMNYEDAAKNNQFLPLPLSNMSRGKARPQAAVVFDTNDPMKLNRVRIKYPWQKTVEEKEPNAPKCLQDNDTVKERRKQRYEGGKKNLMNASPWIRVTAPMAGKGYGVNFRPLEGDEVMVDYENGDMERPFVVGSLFSQRTDGPSTATSITSPVGDKIQFFENKSTYLFTQSFLPVLNTLQFFYPKVEFEGQKEVGGGICIQDKNGFNKMLFDTSGRAITISSAIGNVTVDALKGITIKAPLGKVSIEGKDIEIKASNKLTLQSGTNIKKKKHWRKDAAGILTGLASNLEKDLKTALTPLDMDLLRCIWDAIMRPVDGTLKISSARYLCLEGGKGVTSLPQDMMIPDYRKAPRYGNIKATLEYIVNQINPVALDLLQCKDAFETVRNRVFFKICEMPKVGIDFNYKCDNAASSRDDFKKYFRLSFKQVLNTCRTAGADGNLLRYDVENFRTEVEKYKLEIVGEPNLVPKEIGQFEALKTRLVGVVSNQIDLINAVIPREFNNIQIEGVADDVKDRVKDILNDFMRKRVQIVFDSSKDSFCDPSNVENVKIEKRKALYDVIQIWNEYIGYDAEILPSESRLADIAKDTVTANAENWSKYLTCLYYEEPETHKTLGTKMKESFFKNYHKGTDKYKDFDIAQFFVDDAGPRLKTCCEPQFIWNPHNKGGILISDTDGNTSEIKGGTILTRSNNIDMDFIKDLCKG